MTFFNPLWDLLVSYNFLQVAILGHERLEQTMSMSILLNHFSRC